MIKLEHSIAKNLPPGHARLRSVVRPHRVTAKALALQGIISAVNLQNINPPKHKPSKNTIIFNVL
jgi:hypothetical protein